MTVLRIFGFLLAIFCLWTVFSDVILRNVGLVTLFTWGSGLLITYLAFPHTNQNLKMKLQRAYAHGIFSPRFVGSKIPPKRNTLRLHPQAYAHGFSRRGINVQKADKKIIISSAIVLIIGLILRIIPMFNTYIFHTDEYLTAYFSYSLEDITKLDWFGVYPAKGIWVSQFPLPYFFLQKLFFNVFGLGTFAMRFSVMPYIILVLVFIYLLTCELFNKKVAFIATTIFALFSPDLYLGRWALHFISSTAFFLMATYFFVKAIKSGKKIFFGLTGLFLSLCYMTYYSSYVAFPLLFLYFLVLSIKREITLSTSKNLLLSLIIFLYSISPFIVYALKVDNFYTQRTDQVGLINGAWSPYKNINSSKGAIPVFTEHTLLSIKSLYTDGIGGQGGYFFGKFALFDWATILFLLSALIYFVLRILFYKDTDKIFLIASIAFTFITGIVLTMPPPAFHRMSVVFPFFAIILAVTIYDGYMWLKVKIGGFSFILFTLCLYAILLGNTIQFTKILRTEETDNPDYPRIEDYLNEQGKKQVKIAAFDRYGLSYWLFVRSGGRITSETKSLDLLLEEITPNKSTPLVVLYPDEYTDQIILEKFPNSRIIGRYIWHSLYNVN